MTKTNVWREGALHVQAEKCATCIFRPGNLMSLEKGRVEGMVAEAVQIAGVIPCHDTLGGLENICRGFWDVHRNRVGLLQVAERMGLVVEVGLS